MAGVSDCGFDEFLERDGVWCQVLRAGAGRGAAARPALFVDRDGLLVEEVGYLQHPRDLRLMPGAGALVGLANRRGCPVVLVSNQSGVGRGFYGWADFAAVQNRLEQVLSAAGAALDMVLACPHHPAAAPPYRHPDHPCRKPRPGMILRAAERLAIDLGRSWIAGDRAGDLAAGRAAGLAGGLLLAAGRAGGERAAASALVRPGFEVRLAESLTAALDLPPLGGPA